MSSRSWSRSDEAAGAALVEAVGAGDLAGALLAIEGAGPEEAAQARAQLRAWGQLVGERQLQLGEGSQVRALSEVLVQQLGFSGAGETYHDPRNSLLTRVLERRRGLPILLAGVWALVGEAAGIPVWGVGLPFHFIAQVGGEGGVYVDPFKGGEILSSEDCMALVQRLSDGHIDWDPTFLEPVDMFDLVERVLRNLMNAQSIEGDVLGLYRAIRMINALSPDAPHYRLAHGRIAEFLGDVNVAHQIYTGLVQGYDGTLEAEEASQRLVAMVPGGMAN